MEKNVKTYRIHRALGLLYGLASTLFIFFTFQIPDEKNPMIFGMVLFLGLSAIHFATANGAKKRQNWARITSKIIAVLMLFGFPIGTLIGGSLLVCAWRPWGPAEV